MRADRQGNLPRIAGDDLVEIPATGAAVAQRLAAALRRDARWLEVVPGGDCVCVQFDPLSCAPGEVIAALTNVDPDIAELPGAAPGLLEMTVCYGGDAGCDLGWVCAQTGISEKQFVRLHTAKTYTVEMLGFTPGFAYLGGLDPQLDVARLEQPRRLVAAGSVGIAGRRTGIYSLSGPGGWPIVGRIEQPLFDAKAENPFLLRPGMRVRFVANGGAAG